jgi:hypothetical protein
MRSIPSRFHWIHHASGTVLAVFFVLHVSNHLFALAGPSAHVQAMTLLRKVYRFPPLEALLLLCVLGQVITGLPLLAKQRLERKSGYDTLQLLSGLYLSFFMIYHVQAVLVGRWVHLVETDYYFAAGVANHYPEKLFFIPYYTLSLLSAFVHIACAHRNIRLAGIRNEPPEKRALAQRRIHWQTGWIISGGALVTALVMLALTGVL